MKTIYRAFDGKEFESMDECLEYEKNGASKVKECINIIKEFCYMFSVCDDACPFYDGNCDCCQLEENPSNW